MDAKYAGSRCSAETVACFLLTQEVNGSPLPLGHCNAKRKVVWMLFTWIGVRLFFDMEHAQGGKTPS